MRKIYLVSMYEWGYDQCDGFVVVADDETEALQLCNIKANKDGWNNLYLDNVKDIVELGKTTRTKGLELSSYNAG